jgi:transcriptional regulator with XRE-family HTH domain
MKRLDFRQDLGEIGRRMRRVRELTGIPQGRMSRLLGIKNQSTYGNYEAGRSVPLDFVIHFHGVCNERLGVRFTLDWLLRGVGKGPHGGQDDRAGRAGLSASEPTATASEPNGKASVAPPSPAKPAPEEAGNIDERITEHIARSTEVLRELLQPRTAGGEGPEALSLHPSLRDIPFAVIDMMSVIRYASPGACRLFKTTADAVVGQSSMRFGKTALEGVVPQQIESVLTKGYWAGQVDAHTSRFETLPLVMVMWLMRDGAGDPCLGLLLVPRRDVEGILEELKGLSHEAVLDHVAWEHSMAAAKPKPDPSG